MKLKNLEMALFVICALGVVMASSAFAARAVTEDQTWTIEGVTLSGSESVSSTGTGTLITKVGTTPLELEAANIRCLSCKIENSGSPSSAVGSGTLEFTGVTVKTPAVCAAKNIGGTVGIIKTNALEIKADYMMEAGKEPNYILFKPVGSSTLFVELELLKGSGACPLSGKYKVTGEVFAKSVDGTGIGAERQEVKSSEEINKEASNKAEPLQFGGVAAVLNGSASFALSGANSDLDFGTK